MPSDQTRQNHQSRVREVIRDGVARAVLNTVRGDSEAAKAIARRDCDIIDAVFFRLNEHYSIRPRVRRQRKGSAHAE